MKPVVTLVLVADDRAARFLVNEGVGKGLHQVAQRDGGDSPEMAAEFADRGGRGQAAPGTARHGMAPRTTVEDQRRGAFAADLVEALGAEAMRAGADRLIVVAPAPMLGTLRAAMPPALAAKLAADLPKDLTHVAVADLPDHLAEVAAF